MLQNDGLDELITIMDVFSLRQLFGALLVDILVQVWRGGGAE